MGAEKIIEGNLYRRYNRPLHNYRGKIEHLNALSPGLHNQQTFPNSQ